eukprot:gene2696-3345_t
MDSNVIIVNKSVKKHEQDGEFGVPVPNWSPRMFPENETLIGTYVDLEPLSLSRTDELFNSYFANGFENNITFKYILTEPLLTRESFNAYINRIYNNKGEKIYSIIEKSSGTAIGLICLMSFRQDQGSTEIGKVIYSEKMQRTKYGTEACFLLGELAMDKLGYRRLEWKCHRNNSRSKNAALRYGFVFEGIFRNHMVVNGRNRDSCYYSIISEEWPICRNAFKQWLAPSNFDQEGNQIQTLGKIRESLQRDEEFKQ